MTSIRRRLLFQKDCLCRITLTVEDYWLSSDIWTFLNWKPSNVQLCHVCPSTVSPSDVHAMSVHPMSVHPFIQCPAVCCQSFCAMFICTMSAHPMFIWCSYDVRPMFILLISVRLMFVWCPYNIHMMFVPCPAYDVPFAPIRVIWEFLIPL